MLGLGFYFKIPLIIYLVFLVPINAIARPKIPFGDVKVRVLERREEHIHTAALICSLYQNGATEEQIKDAWSEKLISPISDDDKFVVKSIMKGMCPEIYE